MGSITTQNQKLITDTNKEELKEPLPNNSQGTNATGTMGAGTTTSTDTKLGAGKTQWVNTRQCEKPDGIMNSTIGEIRKAIDDNSTIT